MITGFPTWSYQFISYVSLGKIFNFSEPQPFHLYNKDSKQVLLGGLNYVIHVNHLTQCLIHGRYSINNGGSYCHLCHDPHHFTSWSYSMEVATIQPYSVRVNKWLLGVKCFFIVLHLGGTMGKNQADRMSVRELYRREGNTSTNFNTFLSKGKLEVMRNQKFRYKKPQILKLLHPLDICQAII